MWQSGLLDQSWAVQFKIDLLVEFEDPPRKPLGLMTWVRLERELAARSGRRVDMVSARGVSRHLAPHIEAEKVVLYEKAG